jgi:hypothetical protein
LKALSVCRSIAPQPTRSLERFPELLHILFHPLVSWAIVPLEIVKRTLNVPVLERFHARYTRIEYLTLSRRRAQAIVEAVQNPERLNRSYSIGTARKGFKDGAQIIRREQLDGAVYALFAFDLEKATGSRKGTERKAVCGEVVDDLYDEFGRKDVEKARAAAVDLCSGGR